MTIEEEQAAEIQRLETERNALRAENEKLAALSAKASQEASQLRAALAFYADKDTWRSSTSYMCGHIGETRASMDRGEKARAAATALKETGDE